MGATLGLLGSISFSTGSDQFHSESFVEGFHLIINSNNESYFGAKTDVSVFPLLDVNYDPNLSDEVLFGNPFHYPLYHEEINVCPDYIRIDSIEEYDLGAFKVSYSSVTKKNYEDSLANLYKGKVTTAEIGNKLYGLIEITNERSEGGSSYIWENISKYVNDIGGMTLINKSLIESYPNERLSKFKNALLSKTDEDILQYFPIDQSVKNTKTINRVYYDATKDFWKKYMYADLNDPKGMSQTRKYLFANWFQNVDRYVFEEDLNLFKQYFKYLYEDYPEYMSEEFSNDTEKARDAYDKYIDVINGMLNYESAEADEMCFNDNYCSVLCSNQCSGPAFEACKNSTNSDYNKCYYAYYEKNCRKVAESSFKSCMIRELGNAGVEDPESFYNNLIDKREKRRKEIEKKKEDALDEIESGLNKLKNIVISLQGIHINKNGYKVNCSEADFLHKFYVGLRIIAPILVILFGTLDYFKSLIGIDEKKILEARKKLPKRIILLILFILIPIIISILVNAFMTGDNTSLMTCIIKGK